MISYKTARHSFARILPSFAVGLLACGPRSGGMPAPTTKVERVQIENVNSSIDLPLTTDPSQLRTRLDYSPSRVWQALPEAYALMSIPTEGMNPAQRLFVGNTSAYRRFNDDLVSRFVDCGTGLTGPNADSYRVQLRIETQVDSVDATSSNLRTRVLGSGSGAGGTAVRCATTGELERRLATRLKLLLASKDAGSP